MNSDLGAAIIRLSISFVNGSQDDTDVQTLFDELARLNIGNDRLVGETGRLRDALAALEAENALLRGGRDEAGLDELVESARELGRQVSARWRDEAERELTDVDPDGLTVAELARTYDEWDMRGRCYGIDGD